MKVLKNSEIEINFSLFPSVGFYQHQIEQNKRLIEKLNAKKRILSERIFEDELGQIDNDITLIKIEFELAKSHTTIITKTNALNEYVEHTIKPHYEDMVNNFSKVILEAHQASENDNVLKEALSKIDWEMINQNYDQRINHYLAIKKYLEGKYKNE